MLCQVGIDHQDQDTRVEELGVKHSVRDGRKLFTNCVFSYPSDQVNDTHLENDVHKNDDK